MVAGGRVTSLGGSGYRVRRWMLHQDRSPGSSSATCPRSSRARTARCSLVTWVRMSSRWNRRMATRRVATGRRSCPRSMPRRDAAMPGESGYYLSVNRNKRDIRLDIGTPDGAQVLERLLAASDVLIENFRPGSLAGLGFDDDRLGRINPRLVRLSITGYGPTGPDSDRPGFDFIIQAVSGLMSITGYAGRGGRRADQGRGRHRRPDHGDAGRRRDPRRTALAGR